MRKFFYLFTLVIFTGLLFTACDRDEDDEVFYSGNKAKEIIKGQWNLQSMEMKSNSADFDDRMNSLFSLLLKNYYEMELTFKDEYVDSKMTPKNGDEPQVVSEKYYINGNKMYVEDITLGETVTHDFILTNYRFEIIQKNIDKQLLIQILSSDSSIDIEYIADMIPSNFMGEVTMKLKR